MCKKVIIGIYGVHDRNNLDIPQMVHDHNLAISENGKITHFIQLERITGRKRDNKLHDEIDQIVRQLKLIEKDVELVFVDNVVGRAFISSSGNIRFEAPFSEKPEIFLEKGKAWWFNRNVNGYAINHELAHIFSAVPFFGSFKDNSLLVHFDGGASHSNFSAWHFKNNNIHPIEHHWDLKYITTLFNANALTFGIIGAKLMDQNSVPGKLMGFASFGQYRKEIENWLVHNNWFESHWSNRSEIFRSIETTFNIKLKGLNQKNAFIQDIASTIQHIFTRELCSKLQQLQQQTQADYLYYTGGSALNIVANTKIINLNIFKDVFIPPCTEDSGLALGAVAFYNFASSVHTKTEPPYLNNFNLSSNTVSYHQETIEKTAELLIKQKVIGICNAYGEAGPRALGNRSIIALANSKQLSRKVSMDIKQREWYRPVAPIMLERNAKKVTGLEKIHHLAKYMLLDFAVLPEFHDEMAGVLHVNGTARIQTLFSKSDNPFLFDLLSFLEKKYGILALINTSFNGKGQPIVHTPNDASRTAYELGLNAIIIQGKLTMIQ